MRAENWGPSVLPEKKEYSTRQSSGAMRETTRQQRAAMAALARTSQLASNGEVRTVFIPTREQMPVCAEAGERRGNVYNSEWALLDTLEVNLFMSEKDKRTKAAREAAAAQRAALDEQAVTVQQAKHAALAAKAAELAEANALAELAKADEKRKMAEQREANMRIKQEREAMLADARSRREADLAFRREEAAKLVAAAQAGLEADRRAAEAKMAALRDEAARTLADNAERLAARKAAEAQQKLDDFETSKRMIEAREAAERARDGQAAAFAAMVAARARGAGQKAYDDKLARLEREDRLVQEALRETERKEAARAAWEAQRKVQLRTDLVAGNEEIKRQKAARLAAEAEQAARERALAEARSAAEKAEAERALAAAKDKVAAIKRVQAAQADEARIRVRTDDVFMTDTERRLNKALLEQAVATVVAPKQYSVRLY
ncbi:hypothetical protein HYH03_006118 [Edaphochlamys debaryana]|uniref:Uncharacterized protein n=1 Tax=Edaphochlamys debaryana TaxID=47281 RepID=A0A836C0M1_9CHLO|nr:hypothetical protein HYH03_006118 [Edaphochlamys debaryana]|eukprot:KAG2495880.1 hypothetical protein HYH03_006118 [Edaphochlamys debaryana]